jgi:hypothetical protein
MLKEIVFSLNYLHKIIYIVLRFKNRSIPAAAYFFTVDKSSITGYNIDKEKAYAFSVWVNGNGRCGAVFRFSDPFDS